MGVLSEYIHLAQVIQIARLHDSTPILVPSLFNSMSSVDLGEHIESDRDGSHWHKTIRNTERRERGFVYRFSPITISGEKKPGLQNSSDDDDFDKTVGDTDDRDADVEDGEYEEP